ncbi:MAG: ATP-dependent helicase [Deltaproteobacteria bacterium]|nr:ATP-dependent helicase [Deltaproteobacteria bacterium]
MATLTPFALSLGPGGDVSVDALPPEDSTLPEDVARELAAAFAPGSGAGLLRLGAAHRATSLPPSAAYWRDLAAQFMHALCALPGLDLLSADVEVPWAGEAPATLAERGPPMRGLEYLDAAVLQRAWQAMQDALRRAVGGTGQSVQAWLGAQAPQWNQVGRVCFHLAENKQDETRPFAFLATYTASLSAQGKPQHRPLGHALTEYAGKGHRQGLLALLLPVQKAARSSALVARLLDSEELFQPLRWTPAEAHAFLKDAALLEESGVLVRVPDWWRRRAPARVGVQVTLGAGAPSRLGLEALLDFKVNAALDGDPLTAAEWRRALASTDGLVRLKGQWVEVDAARLRDLMEHWQRAEREHADGVSFLEAMRLVSRAPSAVAAADDAESARWTDVTAGPWLRTLLEGARAPEALAAVRPGKDLKASLRPYQDAGVRWLGLLNALNLGACLADDMGLGKTVQVLALLLAQRSTRRGTHLLVVPASLVGNWLAEMERFTPTLRVIAVHSSVTPAAELETLGPAAVADQDVVLTTYGMLNRCAWLKDVAWDTLVVDEAQALKNPGARQTRDVKALRARARIALTGTPVENRVGDLWSLFDFLNPGLLGTPREFKAFLKRLGEGEHADYTPLRSLVRPYVLRRMKSDKRIIDTLPDKTEVRLACGLVKEQAALYQRGVRELAEALAKNREGIQRKGMVLAYLMRFKQVCNHPSQWLGDGRFAPADSGKFLRLTELAADIAQKQEKVLVFTQFQEMTAVLHDLLAGVFGRPGAVLDGKTPVKARQERVARFQEDPSVGFMVLSVKAGGTGLNLTAASHVIHFDRWWNPAVENQATDRAYRIGQHRNVMVHKFVCRGTVEERIDALIESKQKLARDLLDAAGETLLTELQDDELIRLVQLDLATALEET